MDENILSELSSKGYWPAAAMVYFKEKKYSQAVGLCLIRLEDYPNIISGRIILGRALYHSGQYEAAEEQFYGILQRDPNNLVALKYLGDLKFKAGDEVTAFSYYLKVLEINPQTGGLSSPLEKENIEETKVLMLKKGREGIRDEDIRVPEIPIRTETAGDLLLAQGHTRLALGLFGELAAKTGDQRLLEKIDEARKKLKKAKGKNV